MMIALLLFAAQVGAGQESADDRLFRLGERTHVLQMRMDEEFYGSPRVRSQLAGDDFARSCTAHYLALRQVESRFASSFKPFVVEAMRTVVPSERLAVARHPLNHDSALVAWTPRVHDEIIRNAAPLLAKAVGDYDRELELQSSRVATWMLPASESSDRSRMSAPQLAIACATYFGNHRQEILALDNVGAKG